MREDIVLLYIYFIKAHLKDLIQQISPLRKPNTIHQSRILIIQIILNIGILHLPQSHAADPRKLMLQHLINQLVKLLLIHVDALLLQHRRQQLLLQFITLLHQHLLQLALQPLLYQLYFRHFCRVCRSIGGLLDSFDMGATGLYATGLFASSRRCRHRLTTISFSNSSGACLSSR